MKNMQTNEIDLFSTEIFQSVLGHHSTSRKRMNEKKHVSCLSIEVTAVVGLLFKKTKKTKTWLPSH